MTIQQDEQNLRVLKEAFPGTDSEVIEAVLEAQNNNLENAFESLLSISDPKAPSTTQPAVQEQMRLNEEYAKQLAQQETSQQQQPQYEPLHLQPQHQQPLYQQQHNNNDDPGFNFQEELPIIKERMIEAGNAAKKKVLDLYNQFKQRNNNSQDQYNQYNHISPTNAHYRGLAGDDDLLTGDISAPYLSDYDVYTHTRQTPDAQLKADEEVARKLSNVPPPMPPRKNTVGSSVEFDGDLYNDTGIKEKKTQESSSVPYVIGDDDSDSEDEKRPTLKSII